MARPENDLINKELRDKELRDKEYIEGIYETYHRIIISLNDINDILKNIMPNIVLLNKTIDNGDYIYNKLVLRRILGSKVTTEFVFFVYGRLNKIIKNMNLVYQSRDDSIEDILKNSNSVFK